MQSDQNFAGVKFPKTNIGKSILKNHFKLKQALRLYAFPTIFTHTIDEDLAEYCNDVSECLNLLCTYFIVSTFGTLLSSVPKNMRRSIISSRSSELTTCILRPASRPSPEGTLKPTFSNWQNVSFQQKQQWKEAELTAVWSFNKAMETETDFEVLCSAYSSMIYITSMKGQHNLCFSLEVYALRMCHRKSTLVEIQELKAISKLYFEIGRSR